MSETELDLKYYDCRDDPTECWSVETRSGDPCHSTDPCPAHPDKYKVDGVRIIVFVYLFYFIIFIKRALEKRLHSVS